MRLTAEVHALFGGGFGTPKEDTASASTSSTSIKSYDDYLNQYFEYETALRAGGQVALTCSLRANFSITKELGDIASLSFYANNFFNNMGQVFSTKTGNYSSVSSYIPSFYYGLTLRLKF